MGQWVAIHDIYEMTLDDIDAFLNICQVSCVWCWLILDRNEVVISNLGSVALFPGGMDRGGKI